MINEVVCYLYVYYVFWLVIGLVKGIVSKWNFLLG